MLHELLGTLVLVELAQERAVVVHIWMVRAVVVHIWMVQALGLEAVLDLARAAQMVIMPVLEVGVEVVEVATTVGKHMGVGRAQALVNIVQ
jgi:hypothetical protein